MKKLTAIAFLLFCFHISSAQRAVDIKVGDSLVLGKCSNESVGFLSMDLLIKTRWPFSDITYDTATGEGFYDWFFNGDISSSRLPCKYAGRKFRIASIQQYKNDDGSIRTVVLGQTDDDKAVIWAEVNKAVDLKELVF